MANLSRYVPEATADFYRGGVRAMLAAEVPFLVAGAYALRNYTGIERHTKDFDLFVLPDDVPRALDVLSKAGYRTELRDPRWLAKAFPREGEGFIDLLFGLANGLGTVDGDWFANAQLGEILGLRLPICPPEEMIWSKSFVAERHRYDGADIAHLLRSRAARMDWDRLILRFGRAWRVLFGHLVMFGFIFPSDRDLVPATVMRQLMARLEAELGSTAPAARVCQGTLLSTEQYLMAVREWGYEDARILGRVIAKAEGRK